MLHLSTKFHENQVGSFCIILLHTDKVHRKHTFLTILYWCIGEKQEKQEMHKAGDA